MRTGRDFLAELKADGQVGLDTIAVLEKDEADYARIPDSGLRAKVAPVPAVRLAYYRNGLAAGWRT